MFEKEVVSALFKETMEDLVNNYNFGMFLFEGDSSNEDFRNWAEDYFSSHNICGSSSGSWNGVSYEDDKYIIANGVTRFCIVLKNHPYVFKAEFNYKDKCCKAEKSIYEDAIKRGVEQYFTYIDDVADYAGFHFYVSEKVFCDYEGFVDKMYKEKLEQYETVEDAEDDGLYATGSSEAVIDYLYSILNKDEYEKLNDFCEEYGITDVHAGNIGINSCGQVVIIDYAFVR